MRSFFTASIVFFLFGCFFLCCPENPFSEKVAQKKGYQARKVSYFSGGTMIGYFLTTLPGVYCEMARTDTRGALLFCLIGMGLVSLVGFLIEKLGGLK